MSTKAMLLLVVVGACLAAERTRLAGALLSGGAVWHVASIGEHYVVILGLTAFVVLVLRRWAKTPHETG